MRSCLVCGESLEGRRPNARYCSEAHRKQAKRGGLVVELPTAPPVPEHDPGDDLMTLEELARELQAAIRSRQTPPSAKSGLAKQYRDTLTEIAAKSPKPKNRIDELMERRRARAGA